jgi:glycosyltransferase involved in cell wall biosynthesis
MKIYYINQDFLTIEVFRSMSSIINVVYIGNVERVNCVTGGERQIYSLLDAVERNGGRVYQINIKENQTQSVTIRKIKDTIYNLGRENTIVLADYSQRFHLFKVIWYIRWILKYKISLLVGGFYFDYRRSKVKNFIDYLMTMVFLIPANCIFTTGKAVNFRLNRLGIYKKHMYAIYPAIRSTLVLETHSNADIKEDNEIKQIINVGRFHPVKGYEYLIEAIGLLKRSDIQLTIIGDYNRYPEYKNKVANKIKHLGIDKQISIYGMTKNDTELANLYKSGDICVHSSVWESSPITVCEALMFAKPVIATNVGGTSEYLTDGIDSLLVKPKSPKEIANALNTLLDNPDLYNRMSANAYESGLKYKHRTWEMVGDEYFKLLQQELGRG